MAVSEQIFVTPLIALQFVAFGWRLNREITMGDKRRITWLPLPDYMNLISLLAVVLCCVVIPLAKGDFGRTAKAVLAAAYVLIAFHPISEAAHYRLLFSKEGRQIYAKTGKDSPWITDHEVLTIIISAVLATAAGCIVWHS
jgi:hypothetical protein